MAKKPAEELPDMFPGLPNQLAPQPIIASGLGDVWTTNKAQLIAKYIYLFTMITRHGAYIDGFAGPKDIDNKLGWAAKQVVETKPRRLREIFLSDTDPVKIGHLNDLVAAQSDGDLRQYRVQQGDFNKVVDDVLGSGLIKEKTATFCLIDQFSLQCEWETLRKLAAHKGTEGRKIELFYFLATGWLGRTLRGHTKDVLTPDKWWGSNSWKELVGQTGQMVAYRMSERFRDELGYTYVRPYPIWAREKGEGKIMFHMIHASDHPNAHELMTRAHRNVTQAPELQEQLELELSAIEP